MAGKNGNKRFNIHKSFPNTHYTMSAVKINFEVGHVANLKSKVTQEGFTHDWELFVRSCDSSDISHFIEKVVFTLHESFPKPKRVVKEPPYSIKESGYAGFVLPIDIYFKCRDETKKLTYSYDLNLQTTGTFTNTDKKSHVFRSPSDDFRKKLLRGGGTPVGASGNDDKSQQHSSSQYGDDPRSSGATALGKSKPQNSTSESSSSKKFKTKSEESSKVSSQYANLFGSSGGPPKSSSTSSSTTTKVSPDPKGNNNNSSSMSKTSPGGGPANHSTSSANSSAQSSASSQKTDRSSRGEKSESRDKKDKNKYSSPVKEKSDDKNSNKKHDDRRDEKRKDKTHSKDRDRSNREKSSKHVVIPTSSPHPSTLPAQTAALARSPKQTQQSPVIVSKSEDISKQHTSSSMKHSATSDPASTERPSSSAKKSKKDKKEKSHDSRGERDRRTEKEQKSSKEESRSSSKLSDRISDGKSKDGQSSKGSGTLTQEAVPSKEKTRNSETKPVEAPQPVVEAAVSVAPSKPQTLPITTNTTTGANSETAKKIIDKPSAVNNEADRKHKHKKKDKNKEKEHSKDRKKEKSSRSKEELPTTTTTTKKPTVPITQPSPSPVTDTTLISSTSIKPNPLNTLLSELGDKHSSDSEDDLSRAPSENTNHQSSSADHPNNQQHDNNRQSSITPSTVDGASSSNATDKSHKKSRKEPKGSADKDEKKRKRKSKDEGAVSDLKRKTPSPAVNTEPPVKQSKRGDQHPDHHPPSLSSRSSNIDIQQLTPSQPPTLRREQNSSPELGQRSPSPLFPFTTNDQQHADSRPPSSAATGDGPATPSNNNNNHRPSSTTVVNSVAAADSTQQPTADVQLQSDYMTVLKSLQHKIMTLQDHGEVQHVVEMIAETGCYEMTTSTFDFDLCVLDRTTVQRLLDYFNANGNAAAPCAAT